MDAQRTCDLFDALLPDFEADGSRRHDFLTTFAGKDLLHALAERRPQFGLGRYPVMETHQLCDRVLQGLDDLPSEQGQDVMLKEWHALLEAIDAASQ